jgi:hypothetical protein
MINCEHVSASQTLNWDTRLRRSTTVWPRRWNVNGSPKLTDLVLSADIPEYVPAAGLEAVGRAYAKIIDEANKLDLRALGVAGAAKTSTGGR